MELFTKQVELEINLEKIKAKLALKIDFNLKDLFYFLDFANFGFIDAHSIEKQCQNLGLIPTEHGKYGLAIRLFINRYDMD